MLFRRLATTRIPSFRPLRPPNPSHQPSRLRPFSKNTALLLVAPRAARPQVPYLSQPAFRVQQNGFLGPNPHLARLLSTETRQYVASQVYLAAKWTVIGWTFVALSLVGYIGLQVELEERKRATPPEWSWWSRFRLIGVRQAWREAEEAGMVDWASLGNVYRRVLARLEDPAHDGKDVKEVMGDEGGLLVDGVGKVGFDISAKSYPWREGYFEVIMGCARCAEHLDGSVLDTTRRLVFPKEVMIGPSNPDPRPTPSYMPAAPREENCKEAFAPPETYYMRVLTGHGFTTDQKLDAALAYANYLAFKGLEDSAEEMYQWGVDIAKSGIDNTVSVDTVIDKQTSVLRPSAAGEATPNLLRATTSLAVHRAKKNDLSTALPIFLSILRARRDSPTSPFPPGSSASSVAPANGTDIGATLSFLGKIFKPPSYPPPPPSGDIPLVRASEKPGCEESELMLYIGEILFATSTQASEEGLGWTRQAVAVAEANLTGMRGEQAKANSNEEVAMCKQCLTAGLANWETMLRRLVSQEQLAPSIREGGRNAGWLEWRGWFGRDGGVKGKTLDEAAQGLWVQELEKLTETKDRIVRQGLTEEMMKKRGVETGIGFGAS